MKKTKDTFLRELELQVLEALTKPMTVPQFELLTAKRLLDPGGVRPGWKEMRVCWN